MNSASGTTTLCLDHGLAMRIAPNQAGGSYGYCTVLGCRRTCNTASTKHGPMGTKWWPRMSDHVWAQMQRYQAKSLRFEALAKLLAMGWTRFDAEEALACWGLAEVNELLKVA
jgi:hypothetical protein